jgi:hypothetical protein
MVRSLRMLIPVLLLNSLVCRVRIERPFTRTGPLTVLRQRNDHSLARVL